MEKGIMKLLIENTNSKVGRALKKILKYIKNNAIIITIFISFISMIFVLLTLNEMQTARNTAYMPDIIIEPKQIDISWGESDYLANLQTQDLNNENPLSTSLTSLTSYNIGVGVAKNIKYSFDISSFYELLNQLKKTDSTSEVSYEKRSDLITLSINGIDIVFSEDSEVTRAYLLPNAQESYSIVLLPQYLILIQMIYQANDGIDVNIPNLKLNINYTDVQGKEYKRIIVLKINCLFCISDHSGSGKARYIIEME